jgi:hypothetical protein
VRGCVRGMCVEKDVLRGLRYFTPTTPHPRRHILQLRNASSHHTLMRIFTSFVETPTNVHSTARYPRTTHFHRTSLVETQPYPTKWGRHNIIFLPISSITRHQYAHPSFYSHVIFHTVHPSFLRPLLGCSSIRTHHSFCHVTFISVSLPYYA